jgi:dUTP pyrophosphatase
LKTKQLSVRLPNDIYQKIEESYGDTMTEKVIGIFGNYFFSNKMKFKGDLTPVRGTEESVGIDLFLPKDVEIKKGVNLIDLEISIEIPKGSFGLLTLRSSMTRDYGLLPVSGIIDSDYRGNIKLHIFNPSKKLELKATKKIAQILIIPYTKITNFEKVEQLSETNRKGGFGSTGV